MVDEDRLNMQIRKFLKEVGVTSQREIEKAIQQHADDGKLPKAPLKAVMTLRIEALGLEHVVDGEIDMTS